MSAESWEAICRYTGRDHARNVPVSGWKSAVGPTKADAAKALHADLRFHGYVVDGEIKVLPWAGAP